MSHLDEPQRWGAGTLPAAAQARFLEGVAYCERFFMGQSEVQKALFKLVAILDQEKMPHAIIGALALNEYGHRRATVDVDLILREEDLQRFKLKYLGHGYAERVPGTGKLLDTEYDIRVDVLIAGRYPGDGQPKPIAFPDPATTALRAERFALLPLPRFIELKLASGMTAPHRLHDLADVLDLIRSAQLPANLSEQLHPYVRAKFDELWQAAQTPDPYG
jgi:hypothetical protein